MNVKLEARDRAFYELIASKTGDPTNTSLLELGCAYGSFVNKLGQDGYNAEGVDGNSRMIDFGRRRGLDLHHGELTALEDVFGERTFDLIVARGVFCINSQIDYMAGDRIIEMAFARAVNSEAHEETNSTAKGIIGKILSGSYQQLTPRGFLIVREDVVGWDSIDFDQETAEGIGFVVEKLEENEAILHKPQ